MENNQMVNVGGNIESAVQGQYSIDIRSVLQEAWTLTKISRLSIVIGALICMFLSMVIVMVASQYLGGVENALKDMKAQYIINVLVTLVISPFIAGIEMMGVFHAVGLKTQPKLVFAFLSKGAIIAICALLSSTLSSLGFNLLILPGIFLLVTLSLTVPLVVEKNMMPIKAIILSVKALRFQFFKLLAIYGILAMILIFSIFPLLAMMNSGFEMIGVVFLCFALTYLTPLFYNTKGILYREIFGVKVNASEAPAGSHSDNDDSGDNNSNSGNGNNGSFTA
ncbi:hypothetical protein WNY51_04915 [Pseudocolwellia sp. AS88]|uniref:hypothetical protein n=1 Tax=Pseudocolwellia TaxID=2848177 RepID=UPI0026EA9661|nr:hypothetical protein [Pseudocolwellia sp. AS88]MDO7085802.1 hypothetical protein [Pseudocolwellia sp. AS88]